VIPDNPQSVPQQARRTLFADAVHAWQALTISERIAYRQSVRCWRKTAYHVYIKEYMATH
jgi:alpha-ketoglutarate-dependent taurine dioxygenase